MSFATTALLEIQETSLLAWRALGGLLHGRRYFGEIITQLDRVGFGSLPIIILTGFFTGAVLTLQTFPTLQFYGAQDTTGYLVTLSLLRELGPVLSALMVSARVGSAIAAELGSMEVSQQIEAMRALGTDPLRKLVAPRMLALLISLPLLTVIADLVGIAGGWMVATNLYNQPSNLFFNAVRQGITTEDMLGGVLKPLIFALIIGAIACRQGLATGGGTVGVGNSTTRAVVISAITVIVADFFLAKFLQVTLGVGL